MQAAAYNGARTVIQKKQTATCQRNFFKAAENMDFEESNSWQL